MAETDIKPTMDYSPYVNAGGTIASSIINTTYNAYQANKQREWIEEQTEKQREWDLMMWNKTNEYNTPANQIARMEQAGLNPLNYGLDGSSAQNVTAASPVAAPQVPTLGLKNPVESYLQGKIANKQIELLNSQIDKNKADTRNTELDSDFKEKTMEARATSIELANNLSKEQAEEINAHKREMEQHISKMIEEEKTEVVKQALLRAQTWLRNAQAKQIVELLPYHKLLMEAETEAQKAAAAASFAHAAYYNGLINSGYLDAITEQAKAQASNAEEIAAINRFKQCVRNGTIFDDWGIAGKIIGGLFGAISILSESIGGGLSGPISAGVGAALK